MNLSPLELLVIGVLVVAAIKIFSAMRGGQGRNDSGARPEDLESRRDAVRDAPAEHGQTEAYERARQAWDYLSSEPGHAKPPGPGQPSEPPPGNLNLPGGFDYGDFINGAKAMYARIKDSWYNRDLKDIKDFTTDEAFAELSSRAENEPRGGKVDIMLIEAKMVDFKDQAPTQRAQVFYDVLLKRGASDLSEKLQEVWDFVRGGAYGDHWRLDEIKPVEEAIGQSQ